MKLPILVVVLLSLAGCGGPLCESPSRESQFMNGCTASGTASACQCGWDYLADRHTCEDLDAGKVTYAEISDAADACASAKSSGVAASFKAGVDGAGL